MSQYVPRPLMGATRRMEDSRIDLVGSAAYEAMTAAGAKPEVAAKVVDEYNAEQRCQTPPPQEGEQLLVAEMVRRLENPDYDRLLGRPDDADDLEDEMGRSLLL